MIICLVAAMAANRVIGKDNKLVWSLPKDMKFFKDTTKGKIIVMGRKTFDSLPKFLPNRYHIVISRQQKISDNPLLIYVQNTSDALKIANKLIISKEWPSEIMVIGGAEIYSLFLETAHRIYLTKIDKSFDGDSYFPEFDLSNYNDSILFAGTENDLNFSIHQYDRKNSVPL